MWYISTLEYYSAIKRNEVLMHTTVWMNLDNIRLSKGRQTQKRLQSVRSHLYKIPRIGKSKETESRLMVARVMESDCLMGTEIFWEVDEDVLEQD